MGVLLTMGIDHGQRPWLPGRMNDEIQASEFKATCLSLLDEVAATRREIVVTKRGRPVAKLVPIDRPADLQGSVSILATDESELFSTGEPWGADV